MCHCIVAPASPRQFEFQTQPFFPVNPHFCWSSFNIIAPASSWGAGASSIGPIIPQLANFRKFQFKSQHAKQVTVRQAHCLSKNGKLWGTTELDRPPQCDASAVVQITLGAVTSRSRTGENGSFWTRALLFATLEKERRISNSKTQMTGTPELQLFKRMAPRQTRTARGILWERAFSAGVASLRSPRACPRFWGTDSKQVQVHSESRRDEVRRSFPAPGLGGGVPCSERGARWLRYRGAHLARSFNSVSPRKWFHLRDKTAVAKLDPQGDAPF